MGRYFKKCIFKKPQQHLSNLADRQRFRLVKLQTFQHSTFKRFNIPDKAGTSGRGDKVS